MDNLKVLKTISFILSLVLLLIALTMIVCLFAMPDSVRDPSDDSTGDVSGDVSGGAEGSSDGTGDGSADGSGGKEIGLALALIVLIPLLLVYMMFNALYSIAPLVLNIRQRFNDKNRAIPLLVLDLIHFVCLFVVSISCLITKNPLLHPIFHVLIVISCIAVAAAVTIDIVLLMQNKRQESTN